MGHHGQRHEAPGPIRHRAASTGGQSARRRPCARRTFALRTWTGRWGTPEDVAHAASFDSARRARSGFVTGQVLACCRQHGRLGDVLPCKLGVAYELRAWSKQVPSEPQMHRPRPRAPCTRLAGSGCFLNFDKSKAPSPANDFHNVFYA